MKKLLLTSLTVLLVISLVAQTKGNLPPAIRLIDKQLSLSGMLNDEATQSFIGLEAGDKIVVNCFRQSRKGNASISIKEYNQGNEIFRRDGFDTLRDESIRIPAKGIYIVSLKTGSLLGKDVKLTVDRMPGADGTVKASSPHSSDTSSVVLLNTTSKLYSKNSSQTNTNAVLNITLPPNTAYWVYWIGTGKEALEKMKSFTASCATIGALYPSEPLVLYGKKFIATLPMASGSAKVSYHFMDTKNTASFKSKQQYSSYMFKSAEKITTEYALLPNHQADLNMGISNESTSTQDVQVIVVAFTVKAK